MDLFDALSQFQGTDLPILIAPACSRPNSLHISQRTSWGTSIPPPNKNAAADTSSMDGFDDINLNASGRESSCSYHDAESNTLENIAALGLSFNFDESQMTSVPIRDRFSLDDRKPSMPLDEDKPFNKWMRNLQRRATQRRKTVSVDMDDISLDRGIFDYPSVQRISSHKKSSSGSSFGFVTAVKSASISLASISLAPRSRKTGVSSRHQRTDRSSKASNVGRLSEDSSYIARGIIVDQAVTNRLLHRRRILEEIINTEEGYIADVKFLMNVSLFWQNPICEFLDSLSSRYTSHCWHRFQACP